MTTARRAIVLVLLAAGLCLAVILLFAHHGEGPAVATVEKICGEGKESGCKEVNTGPFSSVGRIPVAALGVAFYASLGLLIALGFFAEASTANLGDYIAFLLVGLGLLVDLVLLGVQAGLIHHFCSLCLLSYVVNGVLFVLLLGTRKAPRAPLERGGGSLLLGAWALGSVSILAGTISGEAALTLHERIRVPSILGSVPSGGA